jgi:signal transduction histidine kinase
MTNPDTPIKQKLMAIILFTSAAVLLLSCGAFLTYELLTLRRNMVEHLVTVGDMTANNSNAALLYDNQKDATEVLDALKADPHIVTACLYDASNHVFAIYPRFMGANGFPAKPGPDGQWFQNSRLVSFQPVMKSGKRVGTLYLDSDLNALYQRLSLYGGIIIAVAIGAFLIAYLLSSILQKQISGPVFALAETARAVSERKDYSVRAPAQGRNEFGLLTDAFNNMLEQIHTRDLALQEAQQRLKEHALELERRVAERTARLSETIAELESFSYSISHDMRAPLRAMQGYSDFVIEQFGQQIGPEGRGYLERISRAGKRLDNLVQDILTYSRLTREQLDLSAVDLDKLVDDIIHQYPGLQEPQAEVKVQRPLPRVIGHEAAITQVISNLLGNAVKFIKPDQKPVIRVWPEIRGDYCRLWIEDNGIGIEQKDFRRIFGIFERVHPDKTYEGTGIGLSIVRKGVERMGGKSGVESELGKGSRFWIELKRA